MSTSFPLDPEVGAVWQAVLESMDGGLRIDGETLEVVRALSAGDRDALLADRPYDERTIDADGVTLSIFTPEGGVDGPAPCLYWVHGGGMVMGSRWMAEKALDTAAVVGGVVVSVEYRLAPEHPAPAPVDDALAGLRWVVANAGELDVDPHRLVLGGDSAGGGISAAVALRLRDEGGPALAGLFLSQPMLDDRMTTASAQQIGDDVAWTPASNEFGWRALLGDRDEVTIYDAPGRATDLSGLPPTFVDVGSADLFRDEDIDFASRIWAAGGVAELHVWQGGYHGFDTLAPDAALSADAGEARRRWLVRTLAT